MLVDMPSTTPPPSGRQKPRREGRLQAGHRATLAWLTIGAAVGILGVVGYHLAHWAAQAIPASVPAPIQWNNVTDEPSVQRTITWLPVPRFPDGNENALGVRLLDKRFNVKIKPVFLDALGYLNVKPLMFASGDIPDVTWDGDPVDVSRDIFQGCILPVPLDLIKKYAPTYFQSIVKYAPMGFGYAYHDGTNWGLPTTWMGGRLPSNGVWRQDWLEKVGIHKQPDTLDEFHEAFRRFTFDDPDGDGKADTYGLTNTTVNPHQMFSEFFGAFGVLPFDWEEKNGQVVWGGVSPEARSALQLLAGWYREGIIDPDLVTDGIGGDLRSREKFINGRVGYASALGQFGDFDSESPGSLVNIMAKLYPNAKAVPARLPTGPGGLRGGGNCGAAANLLVIGTPVAKEPAKLIRILKIMELLATEDPKTCLLYHYGIQGTHWDYRVPDTGAPGTGAASGVRVLPPYNESKAFQNELLTIWGNENPDMEARFMPVPQREFIQKYQTYAGLKNDVIGRPDVIPSASKYLTDLVSLQLSVYTDIIRGKKPIAAFDQFCRDWYRRGGQQMTEEAAVFLEQKKMIYQQLGASD